MSKPVKEALIRSFPDLQEALEAIDQCPPGVFINFCKGGERKARNPNRYSQFIGNCMKGKHIKSFGEAPAAMRQCAGEWRARRPK